jgi:hypothetical protein
MWTGASLCVCAALQWGTAYRLAGSIEQQQQTLQYLEWREKQYDQRVHADVYTRSSSSSSSSSTVPAVKGALVYIATDGPQNVNWLGQAPLQDIARQAAAAVGPSGPNYEYVFRLADAMREVSGRVFRSCGWVGAIREQAAVGPSWGLSIKGLQAGRCHAGGKLAAAAEGRAGVHGLWLSWCDQAACRQQLGGCGL